MKKSEAEAKKLEFVSLRCAGFSFSDIAHKLKVSKPTLLAWGRIYKSQIDQAHQAAVIDALEHGLHTRTMRLQKALELYQATEAAIEERLASGSDSVRDLMQTRQTLLEDVEAISKTANASHGLEDTMGEVVTRVGDLI